MKTLKYEITLITPSGIVTEIYDSSIQELEEFESCMTSKYGIFIQQSAKLL